MAKVADKQQNIKFGGKAKKYIEKYAVKKYNKNNKQTNKRFNQKFADIYNELQNSPEKFYITTEINKMLMPEKSDGEFYYNGKEFFIIFKKHPTDKYGSKFGAMFEEIYHAKQFLDGKVWFENSGYGWEFKGGNALIEYEAKKFATTAKKYGQTYSYTINDAVRLSAKTQWLYSIKMLLKIYIFAKNFIMTISEEIRSMFKSLNKIEQGNILEQLKLEYNKDVIDCTNNIQSCPHCNSTTIIKHSMYKDTQRFKCKSCNRTFIPTTGTFIHNIKKKDKLLRYSSVMKHDGLLPIRTMVKRLNISTQTAFDWRHKILLSIPEDKSKFKGDVQADDLWFLYSQKGRKGLKFSRKRGGSKRKGDNDFQVKLITASDKTQVVMKVAKIGRISAKDIITTIGNKFTKKNKLVTDKHSSFASFAKNSNLEHVSFLSKDHKALTGENVQYVNNLASRLKAQINHRMRGVSTKYLQLYANYFSYTEKKIFDVKEKKITSNQKIWDIFTNIEKIYKNFITTKSKRTYRCPTLRNWKAQYWNMRIIDDIKIF